MVVVAERTGQTRWVSLTARQNRTPPRRTPSLLVSRSLTPASKGLPVPNLWNEVSVGRITLPHRLAMAPMTRSRALADGSPTPLMAESYTQ